MMLDASLHMYAVAMLITTPQTVHQRPTLTFCSSVAFLLIIAPLFGTVLLGMLWKRATTAGGFWGLFAGTLSSVGMWAWVKLDPGAVRYIAMSSGAQDQAQNMFRALWCCLIGVAVLVGVSLMTKPKSAEELKGLVYGETVIPSEGKFPLYQRPIFWAGVTTLVFVIVNVVFW